jgi:hypothetical protein
LLFVRKMPLIGVHVLDLLSRWRITQSFACLFFSFFLLSFLPILIALCSQCSQISLS